jgi:ABC-2 type transport system permease protein
MYKEQPSQAMLAVRPVKRSQLLLAKYLTTLGWGVMLLVLLFCSTYLLSRVLFGFSCADHAYLYVDKSGVHEMSMWAFTLLTYGLKSISLLLFTTVAFLMSTLFRSQAIAVPVAVIVLFLGNAVNPWLKEYAWDKYFLFTNLDLLQYYEGTPAIPEMTMGFSLAVLAVYFVVLLVGSWLLFGKRDLIKERVNF